MIDDLLICSGKFRILVQVLLRYGAVSGRRDRECSRRGRVLDGALQIRVDVCEEGVGVFTVGKRSDPVVNEVFVGAMMV